ncbi:MAG TPA: NADH-quinone oxidoreductase subunit N [Lacibacter sp.]|nr:NADH-quinone oxidoreductase subunit N [Lacibacter sp.]HMO88904.1 NADH-quinone oxidoreductase subunit N [Lacibacter sp.]HMP86822.1 NADH-quinone oxidoreductase subunit N [Lacibacter sp.]
MNLIFLSAVWGIVMMFSGAFHARKATAPLLAVAGAVLLLVANLLDMNGFRLFDTDFAGMMDYSRFGYIFLTLVTGSLLLFFLLSGRAISQVGNHPYEYFTLIFFIMAGVGLVSFFNNLLILFLGIEIISIPLYILTGSDKRNLKSNEAALKYFLMGSFSTGILLLGIAFLYGGSGSFMVANLQLNSSDQLFLFHQIGLVLVLAGLAFKVSAAPFHFWTPDVYDGAPTVFTSFMATIVKLAAMVAFVNLFLHAFERDTALWRPTLAIVTALTLLIGNITAVYQQSVKRMLAYSSIAQAGFMLFAVFAINDMAVQGMLLYTVAYCLATIGIFAVLIHMKDYTFEGFNGLAARQPLVAFALVVFLLSLAGIPLTAGFFAKYFMLAAAVKTGTYLWLVIFAVVMAAVSVYYYFRIIQAMYFREGTGETLPLPGGFKAVLLFCAGLIILLGVFPHQLLLDWLNVR